MVPTADGEPAGPRERDETEDITDRRRVVIMGAAGRDFHNFNVAFRDDPTVDVVAFTATQIPGIEDRAYPAELAGERYPEGIPILAEEDLEAIVESYRVDEVVFAYSDVSFDHVLACGSRAQSAGADFTLLGPDATMLDVSVPVVAVTAVRTGCGKSNASRRVVRLLKERGLTVAAVRHPMPYGDLAKKAVERFAAYEDLEAQDCTIEEREEYEPYLEMGAVIYAGVDYARILAEAEKEADVLVWDGGNNDWPFYLPDLQITLADALRPGHELGWWPGEVNFRRADVLLINKVGEAASDDVASIEDNARRVNPDARILKAKSVVTADDPALIEGRRAICVDDGPTITHGGMRVGAAVIAAREHGASEVVDPRPFAVGSIKEAYAAYPHIGKVVPALGYSKEQIADLEQTLNASGADVVVEGTPIDLSRLMDVDLPVCRVEYDIEEVGEETLGDVIDGFVAEHLG